MKLEDLGSVFHDDEATYVVCKRFMYTIRELTTENAVSITVGGTGFEMISDDSPEYVARLIEDFEGDDVEVRDDGRLYVYDCDGIGYDRDGDHDTGWSFWDTVTRRWVRVYENNEGEEVYH